MVYDVCSECGAIERKRIEERLTEINNKLVRMSRQYNKSMPWLENAEEQHAQKPFHAIISNSNPRSLAEILIASDLHKTNPLWNIKRGVCMPRNASEIAKCVQPMLQLCSAVLFVDPHFNPSKPEYRNTLRSLAMVASQNPKIRRIEYHLGDKLESGYFKDECEKKLSSILPNGLEITFMRWQQLEEGEKLHARYILTDIGGIGIEVGLDEGKTGETTDVSLLSEVVYSQRWECYQRETSAYRYVDKLTITGTMDLT